MREVLSWKADLSDTAVLVNEIGTVVVDAELVRERGSNVVELASGCICCSIQGDLKRSIQDLVERFSPRWLLIEGTGLADPVNIIPLFSDPSVFCLATLFKTITLLDGEYWDQREIFGPLFDHQLRFADLILLNKVDLLDPSRIPTMIREINSEYQVQVVPTVHAKVDPEIVFLPAKDKGSTPFPFFQMANEHHHHGEEQLLSAFSFRGYNHFSYTDIGVFKLKCIKNFLLDISKEVFRIKGWLNTNEGMYFFNLISGKGVIEQANKAPQNRITFIGWNLDPDSIKYGLLQCML